MLAVDTRVRPAAAAHVIGTALGVGTRKTRTAPTASVAEPQAPELLGLPCLKRKPAGMPFQDWIGDVLVRCRGVVAALPRSVWPESAVEANGAAGRIVALDPSRACGQAWWWLWRIRDSAYVSQLAYAVDDLTRVYQTDGLEADANAWLPDSSCYDALVLSSGFDLISLAGFSVIVRYVPPPLGDSTGSLDTLPALQQRMLLELEAGATGAAPAVLATMLVHANDDYAKYEGRGDAADAADAADAEADEKKAGRVVACVTVSQVQSFRLSNLLEGYNKVLGDPLKRPTLPAVNGGLFEMTASLARKVRALASARILKLNMVPDTVVFCPRLLRNEATGDVQAHGFGYDGMDTVKGTPFLWDFDPLYTKRLTSQSQDYCPDCAYVVMMMMLLASARAQHGEAASRIMVNKVIGRTVDGKPMPADELPDKFDEIDIMAAGRASRQKASVFCALLRAALPAFAKDSEPTLSAAYAEIARDFQDVVRSDILEHWDDGIEAAFDRDRPIFKSLVMYLSGSSQSESALFQRSTPDSRADELLDRERAERVAKRLEAVRAVRRERLRKQRG